MIESNGTGVEPAALESREQLIAAWRTMVSGRDPAADLRALHGIQMLWAESALILYRSAVLTEACADAGRLAFCLREAAALLRAKSRPGLLWVVENALAPDARRALPDAVRDAGLTLAFTSIGQAGDVLPLPEPHHPALSFERVETIEQVRAFAEINARANGMPAEDFHDGMSASPQTWTTDAHTWLGLVDGRPVTTAAVLPCDGRLYVLGVATEAEHERHGFGEAVTRTALYDAGRATGHRRAVLHATEVGAPVYPRIGFVPTGPVPVYTTEH